MGDHQASCRILPAGSEDDPEDDRPRLAVSASEASALIATRCWNSAASRCGSDPPRGGPPGSLQEPLSEHDDDCRRSVLTAETNLDTTRDQLRTIPFEPHPTPSAAVVLVIVHPDHPVPQRLRPHPRRLDVCCGMR